MRIPILLKSLFVAVLCSASIAAAQSVNPPVIEYPGATDGTFEIANTTNAPLFVTIEAKSFTIDATGRAIFRPLDSGIHLELSDKSLRLPPQAKRTIYYRASAAQYPAWFCIYTNFAGLPSHNNMNVQLELPHTVYLLGKKSAEKEDLRFSDLHISGSVLRGAVENTGEAFTRITSLQAQTTRGNKLEAGGFPLLPHGTRDIEIDLGADTSVIRLIARFNHKEIAVPVPSAEQAAGSLRPEHR